MAYIIRTGSRFSVRKGNSGETLKTFASQKSGEDYVRELHQKNDPLPRRQQARQKEERR